MTVILTVTNKLLVAGSMGNASHDHKIQYYQRHTKWFSVQDSVIHASGMLRDFEKRKRHEPQASFLRFL